MKEHCRWRNAVCPGSAGGLREEVEGREARKADSQRQWNASWKTGRHSEAAASPDFLCCFLELHILCAQIFPG